MGTSDRLRAGWAHTGEGTSRVETLAPDGKIHDFRRLFAGFPVV